MYGGYIRMCLGVPAIVLEVRDDFTAIVDYGGIKKVVDIMLVPDVKPGDYVIVHAGSIIEKISKEDYEETMSILREIFGAFKEE